MISSDHGSSMIGSSLSSIGEKQNVPFAQELGPFFADLEHIFSSCLGSIGQVPFSKGFSCKRHR